MIFKDKTVIVTGGSEGIGAATARLFAEAGANLLLVARTRKNLERIAGELRDKTRIAIFPMDVSDPEACVDLFKKAAFEFGRVDILINNAGCHARGNVEDVEAAELAKMVDVNLRAPIMLSRLALPYLRESGGGAIVNVGSLYGRSPAPVNATYCATKAGLRFFTRALAEELRDERGIKIALVAPGPVDTGFLMNYPDSVSDLTFSQPMTSAADVAQTILDLCGNRVVEKSMPTVTAVLANAAYLMPWLGRVMRPVLEKKGRRAKQRFKARRKAEPGQ